MKRVGYLYEKIYDKELLKAALHMAAKGKKKRKTVKRILANEEKNIEILHRILKDQSYHPLGYTRKTIKDRGSGKEREIFVPKFFPDQVVQWALILVIKPILMRGMYDLSCASIDERGATYGYKFLKRWLRRDEHDTKYCLKIDISKFYPSIDQEKLMGKFKRVIKCPKTLDLIEKIVTSVDKGVPIGNVTSQWFANFYMQDFDHYVKEQLHIPYYIRYMDDMIFLSSNKRKLFEYERLMEKFLKGEKLKLKSNWQLFKVGKDKTEKPIDFLGYKFYREYITLRGRTFLRVRRRIKKTHKKQFLSILNPQAIISYMARIKLISGNKLYLLYVKPFISVAWCRKRVSAFDKSQNKLLNTG